MKPEPPPVSKTPPGSLEWYKEKHAAAVRHAFNLGAQNERLEERAEKAERELAQAQARIVELEKDNKLWHANWEAAYAEKQAAEKDAARYRWLRQQTVLNFHGAEHNIYIAGVQPSTNGIDATIDAALKEPC
jgi:hypothetical protein